MMVGASRKRNNRLAVATRTVAEQQANQSITLIRRGGRPLERAKPL
jgi:hypothetical protein